MSCGSDQRGRLAACRPARYNSPDTNHLGSSLGRTIRRETLAVWWIMLFSFEGSIRNLTTAIEKGIDVRVKVVASANSRYIEQYGRPWALSARDAGYEPCLAVPESTDRRLLDTLEDTRIIRLPYPDEPGNHWTGWRFVAASELDRDCPIVITDVDLVFEHVKHPDGEWDVAGMAWGVDMGMPVCWGGLLMDHGVPYLEAKGAEAFRGEYVAVNHTDRGQRWLERAAQNVKDGIFQMGLGGIYGFDQWALAKANVTGPCRFIPVPEGHSARRHGYVSAWDIEKLKHAHGGKTGPIYDEIAAKYR